ncbi:hypothetical protein YC2023_046393 [Brassica napus]
MLAGEICMQISLQTQQRRWLYGLGQVHRRVRQTAPVVTKEGGGEKKKTVTMQFLLPEMYKKAEDAPRPTAERVVIKAAGGRNYGVDSKNDYGDDIWLQKDVSLFDGKTNGNSNAFN